jgi:hypothetical protein
MVRTVRRARPGPKPKPAAQKRGVMVRVLLRPDEAQMIRTRAEQRTLSLSAYLREKALA